MFIKELQTNNAIHNYLPSIVFFFVPDIFSTQFWWFFIFCCFCFNPFCTASHSSLSVCLSNLFFPLRLCLFIESIYNSLTFYLVCLCISLFFVLLFSTVLRFVCFEIFYEHRHFSLSTRMPRLINLWISLPPPLLSTYD